MTAPDPEPSFSATLAGRRLSHVVVALSAFVSAAGACTDGRGGPDEPRPQPNLVLVTVDTLRADHLSCYGHYRPTSPRIDRLAASGLVFERAISSAPWTLPSIASIHTSLYPSEHGATGAQLPLRNELTPLAESLQDVGYDTTAVVTHAFVGRRYNFDQGFATFDDTLVQGHDAVTSPEVTRTAMKYLRRKAKEPFFLWIHYFDPHLTYVRHPEFRFVHGTPKRAPDRLRAGELRRAAEALADDTVPDPFSLNTITAVYDEEIAFTDESIGRLFRAIGNLPLRRPTIAALTADHGEYFMERGRFGHGRDIYDELVHVPLIMWGDIDDELRGGRYSETVEPASLAHTFARLAQVDTNPFKGEDLLTLAAEDRAGRPIFSEGSFAWGTKDRKIMVEWERRKLIYNLDDSRFELYDLKRDPGEREDLWERRKDSAEVGRLREALDQFRERHAVSAPNIVLSPEEIERLESLGYVHEEVSRRPAGARGPRVRRFLRRGPGATTRQYSADLSRLVAGRSRPLLRLSEGNDTYFGPPGAGRNAFRERDCGKLVDLAHAHNDAHRVACSDPRCRVFLGLDAQR